MNVLTPNNSALHLIDFHFGQIFGEVSRYLHESTLFLFMLEAPKLLCIGSDRRKLLSSARSIPFSYPLVPLFSQEIPFLPISHNVHSLFFSSMYSGHFKGKEADLPATSLDLKFDEVFDIESIGALKRGLALTVLTHCEKCVITGLLLTIFKQQKIATNNFRKIELFYEISCNICILKQEEQSQFC